MKRFGIALYGVVVYAALFSTLLFLIGWISGLVTPVTVDTVAEGGSGAVTLSAVLINFGLLLFFGLQHSVMARPRFKAWLTKYIPKAMERSTYCLATVVCFALMFAFWQPMTDVVWHVDGAGAWVLYAIGFAGWGVLLLSTFLINHFELFGLAQVYRNFRKRPATPFEFRTPWLYKLVRHPIMLGVLMGIWFAPHMSVGHLMFSVVMTAYIFIGVHFEERDLVATFGDSYEEYRRRVPGVLPLPRPTPKGDAPGIGANVTEASAR